GAVAYRRGDGWAVRVPGRRVRRRLEGTANARDAKCLALRYAHEHVVGVHAIATSAGGGGAGARGTKAPLLRRREYGHQGRARALGARLAEAGEVGECCTAAKPPESSRVHGAQRPDLGDWRAARTRRDRRERQLRARVRSAD